MLQSASRSLMVRHAMPGKKRLNSALWPIGSRHSILGAIVDHNRHNHHRQCAIGCVPHCNPVRIGPCVPDRRERQG